MIDQGIVFDAGRVGLLWDAAPWDATSDRSPYAFGRHSLRSRDPNMAVGYPHGGEMREFFNMRNGSTSVLFIDGHSKSIRDPGTDNYLDIYYSSTTGLLAPAQ